MDKFFRTTEYTPINRSFKKLILKQFYHIKMTCKCPIFSNFVWRSSGIVWKIIRKVNVVLFEIGIRSILLSFEIGRILDQMAPFGLA